VGEGGTSCYRVAHVYLVLIGDLGLDKACLLSADFGLVTSCMCGCGSRTNTLGLRLKKGWFDVENS